MSWEVQRFILGMFFEGRRPLNIFNVFINLTYCFLLLILLKLINYDNSITNVEIIILKLKLSL